MIEIRPHIGITRKGNRVSLPQDQIFVDGERVGYVGHSAGAGICLITDLLAADMVHAIEEAVQAAHGGQSARRVVVAPVVSEESGDADHS